MGDPASNIREAVLCLSDSGCIQNVRLSPVYRTAPVGVVDQDWFANAVVRLETSLSARALLDLCLGVEKDFKRVRKERWGPRTLDIDILLFGDERIDEDDLQVPHPRMSERAFVLAPLADLQSGLCVAGVAVSDLLAACSDQEISRW